MKGARGVLINITGGPDMTLFEVDEAANRVRSEVDPDAFIIFGSTFDDTLEGRMRVSVVATGMEAIAADRTAPAKVNRISLVGEQRIAKPAGQPSREAAALGFTAAEVPANPLFAEAGTGAETDLHAASEAAPSMAFGGISAGGETETAVAGDAFIPPAPQQRAAPEIRRLADPVMGEGGSKARPADDEATGVSGKIANLFNRMTGSSKPARPSRPEARVEPEVRPAPQSAKQSRLGGMTPEERLPASQPEEDLLDIPAFLRRQAN
jgi:cell division protein FtsZ